MSPWENVLLCWQIPILLTFFLAFPKGTCSHLPFIRVTMHLGKGNNQTLGELVDTGAKLTPIPRDQKCYCCLHRVETYRGQRSDDQWSFGPSEYSYPSWSYISLFRMYNMNRCTQQLSESPHWFSDTQREDYCGRKGQEEATKTASNYKVSKSISILHPWRHCRDSCHHQVFECGWDLWLASRK